MSGLYRKLLSIVVIGLIGTVQLPQTAEARITVEDRELVSKRRVGRAEFLYTYTLNINNPGTTLNDVKVFVSCDSAGTTIVDDVVEFGDIPEEQVITSSDTFSLRQNRRVPFDPECLVFEVGFNTLLKISGTVTDNPLPNSLVTATVVRPESGRPIIESGRPIIEEYSAVADVNGDYTLEIDAVTQDDFITLEAQGDAALGQEDAVLTSTVGSVGALQELGSSGSIVVDNGDAGALNITHITTAQDELIRRVNGGELPATDAELATLQSQINGAELLTIASVIKAVIDNPNIVLPAGINNTAELIQSGNQGVFDAFLADLQINFPNELQAATQETADQLNIGFSPDTVPGTLYVATRDELPLRGGSYVFEFDANGGGSVVGSSGDSPIAWAVNGDGELVVDLLDPPQFESFPFRDPPGAQVRAVSFTDRITLIKLTDGLVADQVFALARTVTTFPDDGLPDEVVEQTPAGDLVFLAFGPDGILPVAPDDIADTEIATYYQHQDNDATGLSISNTIGADFLTFNADGTGITQRRQFVFDWTIDTDGTVVVDFDNGDSNRYVAFSENGEVTQVIIIGTLASTGESQTFGQEAMERDGISNFSEANLVNRRYSGLGTVLDPTPDFFQFDFIFLPGGTGCRIVNGFPRRLEWESTPDNIMDSFLFIDFGQGDEAFQRRAWDAIRVEPGLLGPRYYVLEIADFDSSDGFTEDPATTPGRINSYEFVEDVAGQFDPCGLGTSNSLTTLFGSNNGGVGNMFDVVTNAGSIRITELDVNVDYAPNTQFEISVYTVPGSFEDTITAPAVCNFDCAFDASAWTLVATGQGVAQGVDQATFVDIDDIVLDANSQTGFWVTLARDGTVFDELRYTNIAAPGDVSDASITIQVGVGVTGQAGDEGVVRNRAWNGTIYYDTQ